MVLWGEIQSFGTLGWLECLRDTPLIEQSFLQSNLHCLVQCAYLFQIPPFFFKSKKLLPIQDTWLFPLFIFRSSLKIFHLLWKSLGSSSISFSSINIRISLMKSNKNHAHLQLEKSLQKFDFSDYQYFQWDFMYFWGSWNIFYIIIQSAVFQDHLLHLLLLPFSHSLLPQLHHPNFQ
jgi:hypothetical protein